MTISAPFSSVEEADAAYYGEDGGSNDQGGDPGDDRQWGDLQQGEVLSHGWGLAYRDQVGGSATQWFVLRSGSSGIQALQASGQVYEASENDTLADLPSYESESSARSAYQAWLDETGKGDGDDERNPDGSDKEWTDWQKVDKIGNWPLFSRSNQSDGSQQWALVSKNSSGDLIYLAPGGEVVDEIHIYDSRSAAEDAVAAFQERQRNGDVEEDEQPTEDPTGDEVNEENDQGGSWGDWEEIRQVGPWTLFGRSHDSEDKVQYILASQNPSGTPIYLHPEGAVETEPHIYETADELRKALQAWQERKQNEDIPDAETPTGQPPSTEQVAADAAKVTDDGQGSGLLSGVVEALGGRRNAAVVGTAVAVGGYYLYEGEGA
jgi:hypothetical protein